MAIIGFVGKKKVSKFPWRSGPKMPTDIPRGFREFGGEWVYSPKTRRIGYPTPGHEFRPNNFVPKVPDQETRIHHSEGPKGKQPSLVDPLQEIEAGKKLEEEIKRGANPEQSEW